MVVNQINMFKFILLFGFSQKMLIKINNFKNYINVTEISKA